MKDLKKEFGVCDWGYTEEPTAESFSRFRRWVGKNQGEPLSYLADHRMDKRSDLRKVYPEFKSALVFLFDYSIEREKLQRFYDSQESNGLKIASYALASPEEITTTR